MNPDFDYLLWAREVEYANHPQTLIALTGGLQGPHITRDGRICCRSKVLAYVITITAWDGKGGGGQRKLAEIPFI